MSGKTMDFLSSLSNKATGGVFRGALELAWPAEGGFGLFGAVCVSWAKTASAGQNPSSTQHRNIGNSGSGGAESGIASSLGKPHRRSCIASD